MSNLPMNPGRSATESALHLVSFRVATEEFGIDILKVQEIIRMVPITTMPNAPDFVEGVINLRGQIIPVIDFRRKFGVYDGTAVNDTSRRIVVVSLSSTTIGLIVDSVSQVLKLQENDVSPAPEAAKGFDGDTIVGVGRLGDRLMILLDLEQMFRKEDQYLQ